MIRPQRVGEDDDDIGSQRLGVLLAVLVTAHEVERQDGRKREKDGDGGEAANHSA